MNGVVGLGDGRGWEGGGLDHWIVGSYWCVRGYQAREMADPPHACMVVHPGIQDSRYTYDVCTCMYHVYLLTFREV